MDAPLDNIDPVFDALQGELTTKVEHHIYNNNPETPGGVAETLCPNFLHSKD